MRIVAIDAHACDQGDPTMWDPLRPLGELVLRPRTAVAGTVEALRGAAAALTNKAPITAAHIAALPELRYIGVTATGTNIVDLAAAKSRGIAVTNVPGYSTDSVSQHVFAFVLHLTDDVAGLSEETKRGRWASSQDFCFFRKPLTELSGKALVIVGMGAIGSGCARIARGFGMRVIAAQVPGSSSPDRMPLEQALPQADVITLHCPLTPATERLVDERFLKLLKPSAILVNTGRGGLIDEAALARALSEGRLAAACLDVLGKEPPPADHPLLDPRAPFADRLHITPHVAWGTVEARRRLVAETGLNLAAFLRGEARNRVA
jgi:glycerate dehydrogenase